MRNVIAIALLVCVAASASAQKINPRQIGAYGAADSTVFSVVNGSPSFLPLSSLIAAGEGVTITGNRIDIDGGAFDGDGVLTRVLNFDLSPEQARLEFERSVGPNVVVTLDKRDADFDPTNEIQALARGAQSNSVTISEVAGPVSIAAIYIDNEVCATTDGQTSFTFPVPAAGANPPQGSILLYRNGFRITDPFTKGYTWDQAGRTLAITSADPAAVGGADAECFSIYYPIQN